MTDPRGSGLLLDRPWEIEGGRGPEAARRARSLGTNWLLMRLALGERQLATPFARRRLTPVIDSLRGSGLQVWGLGGLLASEGSEGESIPSVELALWLSGELGLDGWVFEAGGPAAARALEARVLALASRRPELGRGLLLPLEALEGLGRRSTIEVGCTGFLRLAGPGGLGLARAMMAPERRFIPILAAAGSDALDRRAAKASSARVEDFLRAAVELGFPAAGVEAGEDRLAALGHALRWPPADEGVSQNARGGADGVAGDQPDPAVR